MAWSIGEELPPALMELFDGTKLKEKVGRAFLLLSQDENDWPHCAMLSYGEVLAADPRTLRLAIWDTSSTTRNLRRTGKATLCLAENIGVFYVKADVVDHGVALAEPSPLAHLELRVRQVLQDGDPNGEVTSGISYRVNESEDEMLQRWEEQIKALKTS